MTAIARFPAGAFRRERRAAPAAWTARRARRWWRYGVTSVVATVASEATLLLIFGFHLMAASWAAVVASLAGTIPSYAMSRYWIWPEADRRRPGRQAIAYWVVALVSLGVSSLVTGLAAAMGPTTGAARLWVVGLAYVGTYGGLWILKFVVYQTFLFHPGELPPVGDVVPVGEVQP